MTTIGSDPSKVAEQFLRAHGQPDGRVSNPADEDTLALVGEFVRTFQAAGADIDDWDEDRWRAVLTEKFGVDEADLPDYLETLASWGVVDNA
jgi:hypothetical protein